MSNKIFKEIYPIYSPQGLSVIFRTYIYFFIITFYFLNVLFKLLAIEHHFITIITNSKTKKVL